jgi:hypothetical protein
MSRSDCHRLPSILAAVLILAAPAAAHHSFSSEYDANRPVTLVGPLARMEWTNPHSWIHVEVKQPDGKSQIWMVEAATPNTLLRRGLRKPDLPAGTTVKVEAYRAKDGSQRAHGVNLTMPDGRRIFLSSPLAGIGDDQR